MKQNSTKYWYVAVADSSVEDNDVNVTFIRNLIILVKSLFIVKMKMLVIKVDQVVLIHYIQLNSTVIFCIIKDSSLRNLTNFLEVYATNNNSIIIIINEAQHFFVYVI